MELKKLSFDAELKAVGIEGEVGKIKGYGSIFGNKDSYGDIVQKGAFLKSISERVPKMLYQHNPDDPIGVWKSIKEDESGLYMEGEINMEIPRGKDVYSLVKQGALDGLSIGFRTVDEEYSEKGLRLLNQVDLFEVSIVTFPANEVATITDVRSIMGDERSFEKFLRDAGLSRSQSKMVTGKAFNNLNKQRDVADGQCDADKEIVELLTKTLDQLKGALQNDRSNQRPSGRVK